MVEFEDIYRSNYRVFSVIVEALYLVEGSDHDAQPRHLIRLGSKM